MAQDPTNPHDAFLKALLDAPERAGLFLQENLPEVLRDRMADEPPRHLQGSFIDPAMVETHSDRLFEVPLLDGRTAFAYVLIEHKSGPDPATPVQLLGYQQRIWQRFAEQDGKGRAQRYRRLPPIIPLVIYHGRQEWSVPLALLDCIDADEELVALQRDFGYQVRHLQPEESDARLSTDPVLRAGLRALAWAFAEHLDDAAVASLLRDLPEGHPLEQALLRYIARVYPTTESAVYRALETTRPERAEELTMTVAEEWIERGKKEGEAALLLRQIERKFGPEAAEAYRERIQKADTETLLAWSDRILTAEAVEDLFR